MVAQLAQQNQPQCMHASFCQTEWWDWNERPPTDAKCVCTYGAVEDHEAVVEVVVLHGGVAVELGQWVVAPGHTQTVKTSCKPTHTRIQLYILRWLTLVGSTSVCRSCWLLCGPGRGWGWRSSEPGPPRRSGCSVRRRMRGGIGTTRWKWFLRQEICLPP